MSQKYDFTIVRSLRKRLGLTLHQLAGLCGLTYTTVENVEKNKAFPSLKTLDALAEGLQIPASDLLSLCEKHIVQRRPATKIENGNRKDDFGLSYCKMAKYDKAKVIRVQAEAGEKVMSMGLHDDCFEICFCLSGQIELTIEGDIYTLNSDDTMLFDGMLEHGYIQIQKGEFITVHIPKSSNVLKALVHSSGQ